MFDKILTHLTCLLLTCVALNGAVELNVASSGGNSSSPLMYGIMFEVRDKVAVLLSFPNVSLVKILNEIFVLKDSRTSITVEMEACMPN
jgi:hypothetical protein